MRSRKKKKPDANTPAVYTRTISRNVSLRDRDMEILLQGLEKKSPALSLVNEVRKGIKRLRKGYRVSFEGGIDEVRMGSPFNSCARLSLSGGFVPKDFDFEAGFQDIYAVSDDGKLCYIVAWKFRGGNPGFRVIQFDDGEKSVTTAPVIQGCCQTLNILKDPRFVEVVSWTPKNTTRLIVNFHKSPFLR